MNTQVLPESFLSHFISFVYLHKTGYDDPAKAKKIITIEVTDALSILMEDDF